MPQIYLENMTTSGEADAAPAEALSRALMSLETASTAISRALVPRLALSSALFTVFNKELVGIEIG